MIRSLFALGLIAQLGGQSFPPPLVQGAVVEVCGTVTAFGSGRPAVCDASLEVTTGDGSTTVVIPAAVRRGSTGGRELQGAEVCASGVVELAGNATRVRLASFDDIRVITAAKTPAFGAGAADTCTTDGVVMPRVLYEVKPAYTETAMRERVEGIVEMDAIVDSGGRVSDVRVMRPLHEELDEQAVRALREWQFAPGTVNGIPAPVVVSVEMSFRLKSRR
jgi:TonB family protein